MNGHCYSWKAYYKDRAGSFGTQNITLLSRTVSISPVKYLHSGLSSSARTLLDADEEDDEE